MMNEVIESIKEAFSENQFLSGGTVLMFLGAILASLRNLPKAIWILFKRRVILTVEVDSRSEVFEWVQQWLAVHPHTKKTKILMMLLKRNTAGASLRKTVKNKNRKPPSVVLTPAPGIHVIRYKGKFIWIEFDREELKEGKALIGFHEILTLRMFGNRRDIINCLIEEARNSFYPESGNYVDIIVESWGEWTSIDRRNPRSVDSLVFDGDLSKYIIDDIRKFYGKKEWYFRMGIPWRRGYFLYGEPGNGKTSLVMAVAGEIRTDICIMNLASTELSDDQLNHLLLTAPGQCIILLEDIHVVDSDKPKNGQHSVTVGGLSRALDGIASQEGRVIFMTTNSRERVYPVLIRPGRADLHVHIGNASSLQAEKLFRRFYPNASERIAKGLSSSIPERQVSMAMLQNHFMRYDDPNKALERIGEILPDKAPDTSSPPIPQGRVAYHEVTNVTSIQ